MSTTQQVLVAAQPAPLHRRFFAYLIGLTIIGAPANAAGSLMLSQLSDLGESGRLIGAVLVALYFGYFDSRLGGGRSLGKRLLGLQVVMLTGGLMSPMSAAARPIPRPAWRSALDSATEAGGPVTATLRPPKLLPPGVPRAAGHRAPGPGRPERGGGQACRATARPGCAQ